MVLVAPMIVLLACGGPFVLDWFGNGYRTGYPAMLLLLAGYGLWAISGLSSTFLQYGGRGRQVLWVNICTLVLAVVLNWFLIPRYEMTGAGVATAVAFGFGSLWTIVLYRFHAASLGRPADA